MHFKEFKTILSPKNGMNIYRGCTHGCIYCDSRSKCYHIDHVFEDIEVKMDAPKLLELELMKKKYPVMIGTGSMTDPYNHVEEKLRYTRKCLEIIYKYNCGISIQTKSDMILRDLDILKKINESSKAVVEMTLTTADDDLCKLIEPNVCVTSKRVEVLQKCYENGIKTVVWLCPFLPFINDTKENLMNLLDMCEKAHVYGIIFFGFGLTLREGNREYFYSCLDKNFPGLRKKYEEKYGDSYEVSSSNSRELYRLLNEECSKRGIVFDNDKVFEYLRTYPKKYEQMNLF